jgi:hypothetical protein
MFVFFYISREVFVCIWWDVRAIANDYILYILDKLIYCYVIYITLLGGFKVLGRDCYILLVNIVLTYSIVCDKMIAS